ncbi:ubiquinol oxidase subunit II [Paenibacillus humicola]|uniref:ubiquinol oxidase subunit II n=1 Tax=Paenibacillus humicola TaxID=3110540 RepID=UPI00237AF19A|nr:ubiquinol oxidase subunit II [Paenibacillus humicola]
MRRTKKWHRAAVTAVLVLTAALLSGCGEQLIVMNPKGPIGESQKDLILIASALCAVVLIPVLGLTAFIVWRYRDRKGTKASYRPNWSHSTVMETVWWGIPIVIIAVLAVVTAKYTYALEPSKPIASQQKAITIQASSLDWKWLFTYPDQGIASVNVLHIPVGVPVRFELTSDGPMNSFWIPQLGGQMYTMSGMAMTLYLQADEAGVYFGSGANFSGEHFADMKFNVDATSQTDFNRWVNEVKRTSPALTEAGFEQLSKPGTTQPLVYSSFPDGLFSKIVSKYAAGHSHGQSEPGMKGMNGMDGGSGTDMKDMDMKDMDMGGMDMSSHQMNGRQAEAGTSGHASH